MVENEYTKLVSVRLPKDLLEQLEADRRKNCLRRKPLSRVIIRALYEYYNRDMQTT